MVLGLRAHPRIAVSHHILVLKIYFSESKRCDDSTSIKTHQIVDFLKVGDRSSTASTTEAFTACSVQNGHSVPWLIPESAARMEITALLIRPLASADRTGASER